MTCSSLEGLSYLISYFCRKDKLLLSADLRPTLALTKISRVCHAPSASLLFAVGDRGKRQSEKEARATDGADEVDTIIKGGKQRGKQSQEFRLSIPAPFRLEQARIFRLRFSRNKIRHRDDFGTEEK